MSGINVARWIIGGLVAGLFIWFFEGVASMIYMEEMKVAIEKHNLAYDMSAVSMILALVISFIGGLSAVFFYAAARPRFGAGPITAVKVALALWFPVYLIALIGYHMMGLFSASILIKWGFISIIELPLATLIGAWIYKED